MRTASVLAASVTAALLLGVDTTTAQTPAPAPAAGAPPAASATAAPAATTLSTDSYSYQPDGRRDPFLALLNSGTEPQHVTSKRGDGPAGFAVNDISVRGVLQTRETLVAMVKGPDSKTYLIHQGDKFADGVVKTVTPQGLVVLQDISDPLSTQKQREVRKLLRSLEDTKE